MINQVKTLLEVLIEETEYWSGGYQRHWAFGEIVKQGKEAVPCIIKQMRSEQGGHWLLWQLFRAITNSGPEIPTEEYGIFEPIQARWLKWLNDREAIIVTKHFWGSIRNPDGTVNWQFWNNLCRFHDRFGYVPEIFAH